MKRPGAAKITPEIKHTTTPFVLLVEDNIIALHTIESLVKQLDYGSLSATNGEDAFELVQLNSFDLVITDLGLPGISGNELAIEIRGWEKENAKAPLYIVGLTAHAPLETKKACLEAGMNKVLTKPISLRTLSELISSLSQKTNAQAPFDFEPIQSTEQLFQLTNFPLFDEARVIESLGDLTLVKNLLHLMISQEMPLEEKQLVKAYSANNWERIKEIAQRTKSSALYCGAVRLEFACLYLEHYSKSGQMQLSDKLYNQLIQVISETQHVVNEWLHKL